MTWEAPAYFGLLLLIPVIYLFSHYLGHKVRMRRKVFFSDELFRQLYSRAWIRGRQVK